MELECLEKKTEELRESFRSMKTRGVEWRRAQLQGLLRLIQEKEDEIFMALKQDLGKPKGEAFRDEVGAIRKSLNLALTSLTDWMKSKKVHVPLMAFPAAAELVPEPLGVVLIFTSWNLPFGLALDPLIGAIAAGNAAAVKPSELAPACSAFLAKYVPQYLDKEAVKIFEGGSEVGQLLLQMKWDKILFTGSARVGRIIMCAAAKHLTPVALELGGKCPAILDHLSDRRDRVVAIRRIVNAKWGVCFGQVCLGLDYIIIEENHASAVVDLLKGWIKNYYGDKPQETDSISRIINNSHFMRLKSLVEHPRVKDTIVYGGLMDEANLYIEPTILLNPPLDSEIMTEEIFGPFLPIITVKKIEDSIKFVNSRPKALAMYVFTKNENFKHRVIAETSSGSVTFNDAVIQFLLDSLPFGGVGESGFGRYHGKFSFDTFSHEKAVLRRSFLVELSFGYPPWSEYKLQLLRAAFSFDYIRLFLLLLGFKIKQE